MWSKVATSSSLFNCTAPNLRSERRAALAVPSYWDTVLNLRHDLWSVWATQRSANTKLKKKAVAKSTRQRSLGVRSSSGTSFHATCDPSFAEIYFVNEASPLPRSVWCTSAPRLVIKPTPIPRGSIISCSSNRRRGWNWMPRSAPLSVVSGVPTCSTSTRVRSCSQSQRASRCFTRPLPDRRTFPPAADLSVSTSTSNLKSIYSKKLSYLQCTSGSPRKSVELRHSAVESCHLLRAGPRFKE